MIADKLAARWSEPVVVENRPGGELNIGAEAVAKAEEIVVPVQVNGKVRGRLTVPAGTSEEQLREMAIAEPSVKPHLEGKQIKKVVVVSGGKLVSIVVS